MDTQVAVSVFSPLVTAFLLWMAKWIWDIKRAQSRIESQLTQLNGSVAAHEKGIISDGQRISYLEGLAQTQFKAGEKASAR